MSFKQINYIGLVVLLNKDLYAKIHNFNAVLWNTLNAEKVNALRGNYDKRNLDYTFEIVF
jgi:hypothetical protein